MRSLAIPACALILALGTAPAARGGPFDGAIIASSDFAGSSDALTIYSRTGQVLLNHSLSQAAIADPSELAPRPRGVVLGGDGRIHLVYGTFHPRLYSFDPIAGTSVITSIANWSLVNNIRYGSISAFRNYLFLPDMRASEPGAGIIRVNLDTFQVEHFAVGPDVGTTGQGSNNVAVGLNGLLYAAFTSGSSYHVFDPLTMEELETISTGLGSAQGFAVGADGTIYTAGANNIYKIAADGSSYSTHPFATSSGNLSGFIDIHLHPDGTLVAGNGDGQILVTDTSFSTATIFQTSPPNFRPDSFVSFFVRPVPEPSGIALAALALLGFILACRRLPA